MGQPAAKMGDKVVGMDIHIVMIPSPGGPVPTPFALQRHDRRGLQRQRHDWRATRGDLGQHGQQHTAASSGRRTFPDPAY